MCGKVNILGKGITTDSSRKGSEIGIFEKYEHYLLWLEQLEKNGTKLVWTSQESSVEP